MPVPFAWDVVVKPLQGNVAVTFPAHPEAFTGQTGTSQDTKPGNFTKTMGKLAG